MKDNKTLEVRYCKKCGCELASDSKHKKCDNCRSKVATTIRRGFGAIGSIAVAVVTVVVSKKFGKK